MEITSLDIGLILLGVISFAFIVLWVVALVRIIKNEFPGQNEKLIWALLVIFLPFAGGVLYFIIGKSRELKK